MYFFTEKKLPYENNKDIQVYGENIIVPYRKSLFFKFVHDLGEDLVNTVTGKEFGGAS